MKYHNIWAIFDSVVAIGAMTNVTENDLHNFGLWFTYDGEYAIHYVKRVVDLKSTFLLSRTTTACHYSDVTFMNVMAFQITQLKLLVKMLIHANKKKSKVFITSLFWGNPSVNPPKTRGFPAQDYNKRPYVMTSSFYAVNGNIYFGWCDTSWYTHYSHVMNCTSHNLRQFNRSWVKYACDEKQCL